MPEPTPPSSSSTAVDDAFERLFGYKFGTKFNLPPSTEAKPIVVATKPKTTTTTTTTTGNKSATQQLLDIFGKTRAARILGSINNTSLGVTRKRPDNNNNDEEEATTTSTSSNKRRRRNYKDIELPQLNTQTAVTETKVFAGQTILTTTTKVASSADTGAAGDGKKKKPPPSSSKKATTKSNIDNVLEQLADPKKMNTVEKTSNDWEQLKSTDANLKEELESKAQSNSAFLVKQDFLNRVDQRKFELEKDQRDRERAKRSMPGGGS